MGKQEFLLAYYDYYQALQCPAFESDNYGPFMPRIRQLQKTYER